MCNEKKVFQTSVPLFNIIKPSKMHKGNEKMKENNLIFIKDTPKSERNSSYS